MIIDEVQRVPDIALAIKAEVDRKKAPGRFLLTGSARAPVLPPFLGKQEFRIPPCSGTWPCWRQYS
ncbi:AAA family ATPase [Gemmatimonadota bacterium]